MATEDAPEKANSELIKFIIEARKRGFDDWQIREPLLKNGWPECWVESAFLAIKQQQDAKLKTKSRISGNKIVYKYKNSLTIHLDSEILKIIEKRAKKNMLTIAEQIEDIVRRSCVNVKKAQGENSDKVDDVFLKLFSRKNCGRPGKKA